LKICERCGKEHDGSFGTGMFCSRSCANTRVHSKETREKTSKTLKSRSSSKYGGRASNIREYNKILNEERIKSFLDSVKSSDDKRIVRYDGIDFGDNYVVTNCGDIISTKTQRKLKLSKRDEYNTIHLVDTDGKTHCLYVHRIVALNFIPNPNNYPIINHKDQDPSNNNVDNLEWCDYTYNATYNDAHLIRGKKISETIKKNGGPWNKGKKLK
jgi:hypothetical protein